MEGVSAALGVPFRRIAAIDGTALDDAFCKSVNPRRAGHKPLTKSEIGCFLSHRAAWEAIAKSGHNWGCVLEDDVMLSHDIAQFLGNTAWIPPDVRLISLETFPSKRVMISNETIELPSSRQLARLESSSLGAAGYILTSADAATLFATSETFHIPVDILLNSPKQNPLSDPTLWQVLPAVCVQQKNEKKISFLPEGAEERSISYSRVKPKVKRHGWRKKLHQIILERQTAFSNRRAKRKASKLNARWKTVPFRE